MPVSERIQVRIGVNLGEVTDAAKTFEEAVRLDPDAPLVGLFLASTYARSGRVQDAAAVLAAYNATRVRQGTLPFVMREVTPSAAREGPGDIRTPEKARLYQGLKLLNIPYNFDAPEFATQRLNGGEIETLFFGYRVHGRSLGLWQEYGMFISPDNGSVTGFGYWDIGVEGTAHAKNDRLCLVAPTTEWCGMVFRNPGGTRKGGKGE